MSAGPMTKAALLASLFSFVFLGAIFSEETLLSVEEIQGFYPEIFEAETIEVTDAEVPFMTVSVDIADVPEGNPLATLFLENPHLIRYLLSNGSLSGEDLAAAARAPDFPHSYFEMLRNDEAFNATFLEVAHRFLKGRGGGIRGYRSRSDRQVSFDDVLNTAVRFVYPDFIDEDGRIGAHICSGINGLADFSLEPDLFLEALVYSTIVPELYLDDSAVRDRIRYALKIARNLRLSTDGEVAVTRAQGAVWALLKDTPELRASLRLQYKRVGALLPIVVDLGVESTELEPLGD